MVTFIGNGFGRMALFLDRSFLKEASLTMSGLIDQ